MSNPKPPVVDSTKTIPEMMSFFWKYFTTITKDESDYIEEILNWNQEVRAAFCMAKKIFEDSKDALAEKE
jgi:hypothetical protein